VGRYVSAADVRAEYPQDLLQRLTDDERLGVVDDARIEKAIAWAEAYVHASIYAFYRVPLSGSPDIVRRWVTDLAVWRLFQRWGDDPRVRERKERVDSELKAVAEGRMRIPGAEGDYKGDVGFLSRTPIPWPRRGGRLP
jgi:phage gp36-like protein